VNRIVRRAVLAYSVRNRRRKADRLARLIVERGVRTVAVVGAVGSGQERNESIVETAVAARARLAAALDVMMVDTPWPYVVGDGRALPWRDGAVDLVVANAVIEHVGDRADQERFVAEQDRVARCVVITTPNRWFPVESHTSTLLLHWLPGWRAKRAEFTRLLSRTEFRALLPPDASVSGRLWSPTFTAVWGRTADRAG
jgi:SAM-dependent methyltransferase